MSSRFGKICRSISLATLLAVPGLSHATYELSNLEKLLVHALAWEQMDSFLKTGSSPFFENPTVYYRTGRDLEKEFTDNPEKTVSSLKKVGVVIEGDITRIDKTGNNPLLILQKKDVSISLQLSKKADPTELKFNALPGHRYPFYCQFQNKSRKVLRFNECYPLTQYLSEKKSSFEKAIHTYLQGKKSTDPNMPNYAMIAYMAVVLAPVLPEDSVCRSLANESATWTSTDIRICSAETQEVWSEVANSERFSKAMDVAEDKLKASSVDTSILAKALTAQD